MKRRIVIVLLAALALGACRRLVVLDPQPDSNLQPDASFGDAGADASFGDGGGNDGGGVQDAGTIGDAAHD